MAEARLAVGFQFAVNDEGVVVNFDKEVMKLMARSAYKSVKRRYNYTKNTILKGVYPASPATWMFFLAAVLTARYSEHEATVDMLSRMEKGFPGGSRLDRSTVIGISILTVVTVLWIFTGYFLQLILRKLLTYFGLLYESRGPFSLKTKIWLVLVKIFSGRSPLLYSFQKSIPNLPVPSLEETIQSYIRSTKPFLDEEKYKRTVQLAKEFEEGIGPKLQRYLVLKSYWAANYVSDWWEQFVYLRSRSPLMINSNYYGVGTIGDPPTSIPTARAANIIYSLLSFRKLVDKHKLHPMMQLGVYPLCSSQYERIFNTTRIPGKEEDTLIHLPLSNHVVVYHKGRYYKLTVVFSGVLMKPADIECQLMKIVADSETKPYPGEEKLGSLTADERPIWAETRSKFFTTGSNALSLSVIERAAFMVILEDSDGFCDKGDSVRMNKFAKSMLHGKGYDRWFDKSFNFIVCQNGMVGFNSEHSWADAPIMAQMCEWIIVEEADVLRYKEDGHCSGAPEFSSFPCLSRLKWDIPEKCIEQIEESTAKAQKLIDDLELHILLHDEFGKGAIKKCKVSPDAFIQMALQLAYFKDMGKCSLTYEAAMTRLFRDGRTETVRSCTVESSEFVRTMMDPESTNDERLKSFKKAADNHVKLYRRAMTGQGVDRHLFCLYVVSQYLKTDVPFLKEVLGEPWRLSTSQTPTGQSGRIDFSKRKDLINAGGGFGPVADDGYGISYVICGDDIISFHISSKKSCPDTNAEHMSKCIVDSMAAIKDLIMPVEKK